MSTAAPALSFESTAVFDRAGGLSAPTSELPVVLSDSREESFKDLFVAVDCDRSTVISRAVVRRGVFVPRPYVARSIRTILFRQADFDGNGKLCCDDFTLLVTALAAPQPAHHQPRFQLGALAAQVHRARVGTEPVIVQSYRVHGVQFVYREEQGILLLGIVSRAEVRARRLSRSRPPCLCRHLL